MNTHDHTPSGRPAAGPLLGLTFALLALLVLNLAVFDDLRTDASAGVLETFTKPQHLSSLLAVLLAGAMVAFRHRSATRVAVVVAWIEIVAFTFFHGIPVEIGPAKPYWGEGMGDALQWLGFDFDPCLQRSHRHRRAPRDEAGRHTGVALMGAQPWARTRATRDGWPTPGHGASISTSRASLSARTVQRSLGSKCERNPLPPVTLLPSWEISISPSTTTTYARSWT